MLTNADHDSQVPMSCRTFGTRPMGTLKRQGQGQEAPSLATLFHSVSMRMFM